MEEKMVGLLVVVRVALLVETKVALMVALMVDHLVLLAYSLVDKMVVWMVA